MPHLIDTLASLGSDALSNHFQIVIPNIDKLGANVEKLNMRVLNIDIPEQAIGTYEITKRGRKFTRPSGMSDQALQVSFAFRCDKYFDCYKSLTNWKQFIQHNENMTMGSDSGPEGRGGASTFRHNIEVWAISSLDLSGKPHTIWTLEGAYPTSIGNVAFDETNGEPIECEVTLDLMNIKYPIM